MLILPLSNNFRVITSIETSFLVYYNFILSVNPSHANFDFNVMFNIYRMIYRFTFAFEKTGGKFPSPLYDISKTQVMLFVSCFYVL